MAKASKPTPRTKAPHKPKQSAKSAASRADRHDLYQRAVQCVEAEIDFVDKTFTSLRRRKAASLREDFCGTAQTSCEWVRRRSTNSAVALDLDGETLEWGMSHNLSQLTDSQRHRIRLLQADVRTPPREARSVDCVLAMNFSYWCFRKRAELISYFRSVCDSLSNDGVFFMDFYGGEDVFKETVETRTIGRGRDRFTYEWDQRSMNPITGELHADIHFAFPDGSRIDRGFSYHWRVWTIPELREALLDAGFSKTLVYWEGDDDSGGGNGVFTQTERGEACPAFICYILALR